MIVNGEKAPEKPQPAPSMQREKDYPASTPQRAPERVADWDKEDAPRNIPQKKQKYERPARTGREPGMVSLVLNVGRKHQVTPADVVGKIAGVTRLPANVVGAIDLHEDYLLVDVAAEDADLIVGKLNGIRVKGNMLQVKRAEQA